MSISLRKRSNTLAWDQVKYILLSGTATVFRNQTVEPPDHIPGQFIERRCWVKKRKVEKQKGIYNEHTRKSERTQRRKLQLNCTVLCYCEKLPQPSGNLLLFLSPVTDSSSAGLKVNGLDRHAVRTGATRLYNISKQLTTFCFPRTERFQSCLTCLQDPLHFIAEVSENTFQTLICFLLPVISYSYHTLQSLRVNLL